MASDSVVEIGGEEGSDPQQPNEARIKRIMMSIHDSISSFVAKWFRASDSAIEMVPGRDGDLPRGGEEGANPQRPNEAGIRRIMRSFLLTVGIRDEQELGMLLLRFGIPMGVTFGLSASAVVETYELNIVALSIAVAITLTFNGLFLRGKYPASSTCMLLSGAALMLLSFFASLGLFLPGYLKWIPILCSLASLTPFGISIWPYMRRGD